VSLLTSCATIINTN